MKKYSIIYADPPWRYKVYSKKGLGRSAESHYPTMELEDIRALPVGTLAADDCVLFLWTTIPLLHDCFSVMRAWGFSYKTVAFVWIKQNRKSDSLFWGMGHWTRANAEFCMPFKVQEVQDKGGIYFGENAISHNLIICNKANLLNQSAFLLGVPGSGKSFSAKELIAFLILDTTDDVLICDPENEFGALAAALGKETTTVIHMAAGGKDRLNAMYMVDGYGENNPIVEKSQFIMSLVEQIDKAGVGPQQKSIIDRCTALVYQDAERTGKPATLCDLRNKLLEQPEEKAKEIALSLELFTTGSLDIFGHESTVDLDKRIVVFDIHGLGEQLKPTGLLVITDTILNRVTLNWKKGKRTHIFIDEFHVVFENEQSGIFFNSAWRQFRKRNGYPTAITQNVEYLLDSVQASTMLSNSEFVVMLNQAFSDRAKLSKLLNISDEQMSYVTNADAGCGLIKYGSALVPFINRFPKDTELYRLMTTRPGEGVFGSGNAS